MNLGYDVFVNDPPPQDNGLLPNGEPKGGSPVASTLIYGSEDAVLTDPGFTADQACALGDWVADTNEMGYVGAAAVFGGLLLLTALLYYFTSISRVILFWAAFILTRPLGAVVGDFLDKPLAQGGLALSRYTASLALLVVIIALILIFPQKPASKAH